MFNYLMLVCNIVPHPTTASVDGSKMVRETWEGRTGSDHAALIRLVIGIVGRPLTGTKRICHVYTLSTG